MITKTRIHVCIAPVLVLLLGAACGIERHADEKMLAEVVPECVEYQQLMSQCLGTASPAGAVDTVSRFNSVNGALALRGDGDRARIALACRNGSQTMRQACGMTQQVAQ